VFDGVSTGTLGASDALGIFVGSGVNAYLGVTVAPAGDYDGDGLPDLLIGAYGEGNGTAYVVPGG
jgi:hypothetical protein